MAGKRMELKKDLKEKRELINIVLDRFLPRKDEYPKDIHKAMRHTLFAGGKRLRPYLTVKTFELFNDNTEIVKPVAAAIELLHTYTLIHDDLPEIDNDDYRRGRKACHLVYGPDIALLAGDSLLTYAFSMLVSENIEFDNSLRLKLIREFTHETGDRGIIAGQFIDIKSEGKKVSKKTLKYIHENKTVRLIKLAIRFGAYVAGASKEHLKRLEKFGHKIGLAFQIVDDILDVEGSAKKMGKTIGKDEKSEKATYPSIYGMEESKRMAKELIDDAKEIIAYYGEKSRLFLMLADFIYTRKF